MRADKHYVDQLDSESFSSPIRFLDAKTIDVRGEMPEPSAAFLESIKRHGVLQPLLVHSGRGGQYRLIAGGMRLAAALALGLREIPCLVQRVDEKTAAALAEATNVPAHAITPAEPALGPDPASAELARSLAALVSSTNLLTSGSALSQTVATDLVRAEATRALHLLSASRVLASTMTVSRAHVAVALVTERAVQALSPECRLRGVTLRLRGEGGRDAAVRGDEELLVVALVSLMRASVQLIDAPGPIVTLGITAQPDSLVELWVAQDAVTPASAWSEQVLTGNADPSGGGSSVLLQAAQRIADLHGGRVSAARAGDGTRLSLLLPVVSREM